MNKTLTIIVIIVLAFAAGWFFYFRDGGLGPSPSPTSTPTEDKSNLIRVFTPKPGDTITSPLFVEGEARGFWFFEASFPIKLADAQGRVLAQTAVQTPLNWMTEDFVAFSTNFEFQNPGSGEGTLILERDNPSGLPQFADELRIPIKFGQPPAQTTTMRIHLAKFELGQPDCTLTQAVERKVPKTQAIARAALEELLKGATNREGEELGLGTTINPGVQIQSLTIQNGVARVDFNEQLEFQVGGSCRVAGIRAQITKTLKEFPTIQEVVISINGRTEDILQP